jgi:GDP-D-mannose 3',5'-epimerase
MRNGGQSPALGATIRSALVCGAGGFIGGHLVERLKAEGFWVRGVDQKTPEFRRTAADEYFLFDLRHPEACREALSGRAFHHVYQLAADMGGMEFISTAECEILSNSVRINVNMIDAAARAGVNRYFYASSACVYRDMAIGEAELLEEDAYPAIPHSEYGWEKLYSERVLLAYARRFPLKPRIGRFENTYGPFGTWCGGREKAPAALCRKVAMVPDGSEIEAFGDGTAVRSYTYIDDLIAGIRTLVDSDWDRPVNIGSSEYVTVAELISAIAEASGKRFTVRYVPGPVGVRSRNFSKRRMEALGHFSGTPLRDGIRVLYDWTVQQVEEHAANLQISPTRR